jgi:succinate dehydrogenase / fumarate reductase cytochrome b subunit
MADTKPGAGGADNRPLSPHIWVYRWQITMMMSIIHRATGVALAAGTVLLAWWLIATATGPDAYETFQAIAGGWFGRLVLFGFTWALLYHLFNGIRHLAWDTGLGFEINQVTQTGVTVIILSIVATLGVWIAGYSVMGAG